VKGQRKSNMRITVGSVLMLFTQIIKVSVCLSKLQLAKVASFFETQWSWNFDWSCWAALWRVDVRVECNFVW